VGNTIFLDVINIRYKVRQHSVPYNEKICKVYFKKSYGKPTHPWCLKKFAGTTATPNLDLGTKR